MTYNKLHVFVPFYQFCQCIGLPAAPASSANIKDCCNSMLLSIFHCLLHHFPIQRKFPVVAHQTAAVTYFKLYNFKAKVLK